MSRRTCWWASLQCSLPAALPKIIWQAKKHNSPPSPDPVQADSLAGLSVAALVIPQGMSYAKIAGLPSVYGLYGAFVPVLIYAALGTSRHLVSALPGCLARSELAATDPPVLALRCEVPHEASSPCCTASSKDCWAMASWVLTLVFNIQAVGPVAVTSLLLGQGLPDTINAPVQANPNKPANPQAQMEYNHAAIQVLIRFLCPPGSLVLSVKRKHCVVDSPLVTAQDCGGRYCLCRVS